MNKTDRFSILWLMAVALVAVLAGLGFGSAAEGPESTATQALLLALAGVGLALGIAALITRQTRRALAEQTAQNERNQAAILQLLDEISGLAEGDLTTEASVTEDFTGAIADSFNYAVDQMRGLVSDIKGLSRQVAEAADESRLLAVELAGAAGDQSQAVDKAAQAIGRMSRVIDQVAGNANESAAVALRSVEIAGAGAGVVREAIDGMGQIRGQIQDTAKRIKRLGESSQEIGDIVALINDIADQTNILSLNAAIQASMAGDAGRGFAVVADEVQRLAERSSAATRQIAALVKTIQSDTIEAVSSMESTTSEVVTGAERAQRAGTALDEIAEVSTSLAALIGNISAAADQQSHAAGDVSAAMTRIEAVTARTVGASHATAASIGELASMAEALQASVQGFTLPAEQVA